MFVFGGDSGLVRMVRGMLFFFNISERADGAKRPRDDVVDPKGSLKTRPHLETLSDATPPIRSSPRRSPSAYPEKSLKKKNEPRRN